MGNSVANFEVFILPVILFWLIMPFGFMLFGIAVNNQLYDMGASTSETTTPNAITYINIFFSYAGLYLKMVFFWIPGMPIIVNIILIALRLISLLAMILIIKR